ncbi:MAG TPA: hypothetical protein PLM22_09860 [Candidatus Sabulitectum sp.]|nr:hypothetical protein [Candidatus Sabulitectum sp.]HPF31472.1 hypothetical protein [Candidatus Sabulitectum sp.]HPJ29228.1 hypothetical protein [Candidatus Sabulitectum sp.]HPR22956.1 hypothetical protein [Candidatus Sabulitectum sp.]
MTERNPSRSFRWYFLLAALASVAVLYLLVYSDMPIYGDAWGYGYNCARWISDNGLPLVPSGTGRGETAMGHGAFYFWMWAVTMKVFGNTVSIAHLLPAVFTFITLAGMGKLADDLGGRELSVLSTIALLASPLFLAQTFRPLPIAAGMAGSVWGLYFFRGGRYLQASAAMVFAVMMRQQAMVVPFSCILASFLIMGRKTPRGIFLLLFPFLVPVIIVLSNYLVNGFLFVSGNDPGINQPFSLGLFLHRLKFFGFLLTGHYRWLPVAFGLGFLYRRRAGTAAGVAIGVLLAVLGALERFQNYFTIVLILALLCLGFLERKKLEPLHVALALIPFLMILSFSMIVFAAASVMQFNFFRYLLAAYPALVAGMMWMLHGNGWKGRAVAGAFLLLTAWGNTGIRYEATYTDTTLAGYSAPLLVMRDAGSWAAAKDVPTVALNAVTGHFDDPALGYTERPLEVIMPGELLRTEAPGLYAVVIPPLLPWGDDVSRSLEELLDSIRTEYSLHTDTVISRGPFSARCILLRIGTE